MAVGGQKDEDEFLEGPRTLFDNTVILWLNELEIGNSHSQTRIPIAILRERDGRDASVNSMNNFFGNDTFCKGLHSGLTA